MSNVGRKVKFVEPSDFIRKIASGLDLFVVETGTIGYIVSESSTFDVYEIL